MQNGFSFTAIDLSFFNHQVRNVCLNSFLTQGKVQFGTSFEGKSPSWSEIVPFPAGTQSSRQVPTNDADDSLSVPVAFVLGSGEIRGTQWSVTSRLFRGIEIITIEQRFQIINNVERPLVAHPVLVPAGKKVFELLLNKVKIVCLKIFRFVLLSNKQVELTPNPKIISVRFIDCLFRWTKKWISYSLARVSIKCRK